MRDIILKYFLIGDESGEIYTAEFNTYEEYENWKNEYKDSVEEFTLYGIR